jgi:hypothetical protein
MVFRSVLSLKGRLNRRHLPPPFKDGENARALVNTFVGMAPGTKSLPGGAVPDLVADTDTLMSKATREKIDNAQENTQTAGYNWGNGIRESLAIALHNDGKRRDPRISLVDGEKDESCN